MAAATPDGRRLGYPWWTSGLGAAGFVAFLTFAWFAWHAPAGRGGLWPTLAFVLFAMLGLVVAVATRAESFVVSSEGLALWRLGRARRIARPRSTPAAPLVVGLSSMPPDAHQRACAPWFEREDGGPPPDLPATEVAEAAGVAFAQRMLARHGSIVPFEARWTADGRVRLAHGSPRGEEPGYAAFRCDGQTLVLTTDAGIRRLPFRGR